MNVQLKAVAQDCLDGACQNRMSFPESLRALTQAGFEGYGVDYRLNTRTYYLPDGETLMLKNPHDCGAVAAAFTSPRSSPQFNGRSSVRPTIVTSNSTSGNR